MRLAVPRHRRFLMLFRRPGLPLVLALLLPALPAAGQALGKLGEKLGALAGGLTLRQLLVEQPLTTNIDDVVFDVPFLDAYQPRSYRAITVLPRAPGGGWALRPGSYAYRAQSYCLEPGTRRPSHGDGYAYAPLKGPQADTIRSILRNSARFPEIPQDQIQMLLWRIIARARWTNLSAEQKAIAARLMSPAQIARLNGTALDLLPGDVLDRALADAVPAVGRTLGAQAEMRELFATNEATYQELEERAVLPEDPDVGPGRMSPAGWSFNPAGYFIRFRPTSYYETLIQIHVPEAIKIETDSLGRIFSVSDPVERRLLRIAYDDADPGDPYPGAADVRAYRFKSVHFERPDPQDPRSLLQEDWTEPAGTLVGIPQAGKLGITPLSERYDFAREMTISTQRTLSALPVRGERARDAQVLANLVHLAAGLERLLARTDAPPPWAFTQIDLIMDAWQYTLARAAGVATVAGLPGPAIDRRAGPAQSMNANILPLARLLQSPTLRGASPKASGWPARSGAAGALPLARSTQAWGPSAGAGAGTFDPSGGMAMPGADGAQRLGQSERQTMTQEEIERRMAQDPEWSYLGPGKVTFDNTPERGARSAPRAGTSAVDGRLPERGSGPPDEGSYWGGRGK